MSDDVDTANDLLEEVTARAMANRVVYEGESADNCAECGDEIPSARQLAVPGCQHCVLCASVLE